MKKIIFLLALCFSFSFMAKAQNSVDLSFEKWTKVDRTDENRDWSHSLEFNIESFFNLKFDFAKKESKIIERGAASLLMQPTGWPDDVAELIKLISSVIPNEGDLPFDINDLANIVMPSICQLGKNSKVNLGVQDIVDIVDIVRKDTMGIDNIFDLVEKLEPFKGALGEGYPVDKTPTNISAYINFQPAVAEETMGMVAIATHWNAAKNEKEYVGYGFYSTSDSTNGGKSGKFDKISCEIGPMTDMEGVNLPTSDAPADSLMIIFMCGGMNSSKETKLYVDQVAVGGATMTLNSTVGIETPDMLEMTVSPNPAKDYVNVVPANANEVYNIRMFDMTGKVVVEKVNLVQETRIDLVNLPKGVYLLEVVQGQKVANRKLVVE